MSFLKYKNMDSKHTQIDSKNFKKITWTREKYEKLISYFKIGKQKWVRFLKFKF